MRLNMSNRDNVNPYSYEIGTCSKTGIKLVYRELTEEMKKHPKYKLMQEICKEKENGTSTTSRTTEQAITR